MTVFANVTALSLSDSDSGILVLAECFCSSLLPCRLLLVKDNISFKSSKAPQKINKCCFSSGGVGWGGTWSFRQALNNLGSSHKSFKYVTCVCVSFFWWDGKKLACIVNVNAVRSLCERSPFSGQRNTLISDYLVLSCSCYIKWLPVWLSCLFFRHLGWLSPDGAEFLYAKTWYALIY